MYSQSALSAIIQQDNTSCHKGRIVLEWFGEHSIGLQVTSWPQNSPNPIQHGTPSPFSPPRLAVLMTKDDPTNYVMTLKWILPAQFWSYDCLHSSKQYRKAILRHYQQKTYISRLLCMILESATEVEGEMLLISFLRLFP